MLVISKRSVQEGLSLKPEVPEQFNVNRSDKLSITKIPPEWHSSLHAGDEKKIVTGLSCFRPLTHMPRIQWRISGFSEFYKS